ncbi:MAG TPA: asparagine synthase (glutamine-hydrolyzing) [Crocinitomicaceae bacterium]|nr:asparagine synthase (glutamine-hydrolyzing) [Crocinitomicaceae bacterium]
MCGISGIISVGNKLQENDFQVVEKMTNTLRHRGPDGTGFHHTEDCSLGNTRLAIIDPSLHSNLPLSTSDGKIWIAYNGEVSNFTQLRQKYKLTEKHQFKGHSDTEVLLYLYKELGISFINELTGMFAFCLYDSIENKCFLVRDFYGILPLFYYIENEKLFFASEIKAFLEIPHFRQELNLEAFYHFFSLAYIPGNNTPYNNLEELRGGELIEINLTNYQYEKRVYYDFQYEETDIPFEEAKNKVRDLLFDSVERNLISDAPLGMTLSGGIDTSSMLSIVHQLGKSKQMNTFSLKMGEKSFDESPYQRLMAKKTGSIHHEILVKPEDVIENIYQQISYTDEPTGDGAAIPSFILSKVASKHVKTLLSGEGGDEVFNAYPTITAYQYRKYYRLLPKLLRSGIKQSISMLPSDFKKLSFDFKAKRFTNGAELDVPEAHLFWRHVFLEEDKQRLINGANGLAPTDSFYRKLYDEQSHTHPINRISYIDMKHFFMDDLMVKNDRTFLANSVEGRFPLMDRFLVEYVSKLPVKYRVKGLNQMRYIQKEAMKGILPEEIRRRQGFGLEMPHSIWFLEGLGNFADKYFTKEKVEQTEILNWEFVEQIWQLHKAKKFDYGRPLWCILNFLLWHEMFVEKGNYKSYWR